MMREREKNQSSGCLFCIRISVFREKYNLRSVEHIQKNKQTGKESILGAIVMKK
jgi:hypothetical protein